MKDPLLQVNKEAAEGISRGLLRLTGQSVTVEISPIQVGPVEKIAPQVEREEIVAGIHLPITGDAKGAVVLVFPRETAFVLSDLLVQREPGTTRKLTKLDESALKEVGNIVSGAYLTVLSGALQIEMLGDIPQYSFDMCGAIFDQIISKFALEAEEILVGELRFVFQPITLTCRLLLILVLPETKLVRKLLGPVTGSVTQTPGNDDGN